MSTNVSRKTYLDCGGGNGADGLINGMGNT